MSMHAGTHSWNFCGFCWVEFGSNSLKSLHFRCRGQPDIKPLYITDDMPRRRATTCAAIVA